MELPPPPRLKKRRTSSKHSQTGCRTCKSRHVKCGEQRPRCANCEKSNRECEYDISPQSSVTPSRPSPIQHPIPSPVTPVAPTAPSNLYFDPNFGFPGPATDAPGLPVASAPTLPVPYPHDALSTAPTVDLLPPNFLQSHIAGANTPMSTSIKSSPQLAHPVNPKNMVRNATFVNDVQSRSSLQTAIRTYSLDYRLPGQEFTVETVLSPMIFRSVALRHAIFANFLFQREQTPLTSPSPVTETLQEHPYTLHSRHYQAAMNQLNGMLGNADYPEANLAAHHILGTYCLVKGDLDDWTYHNQSATALLRARGQSIRSHPPSLSGRFLFQLHIRLDTVASNAVGLSATSDAETIRIAYSGIPISSPAILSARMELELLLGEISTFQFDCSAMLPLVQSGWESPPQMETLRARYHQLLKKLGKWSGLTNDVVGFEEAEMGDYIQGSLLPSEMGTPLFCYDQGFAQLWVLHCTATVHIHCVAARHHLIPRIPDEVQARAILCCRILSGRSMIDAFEPSPPVTWPLVNMSYILNSEAGKVWAADQIDSIARRYLPKSTRRIASTVRENLNLITESVKTMGSMVPPLPPPFPTIPGIPNQSTIAAQFITSSPETMSADAHLLYTGTSTNPMETQSQVKLKEDDVYAQGPHSWDEI